MMHEDPEPASSNQASKPKSNVDELADLVRSDPRLAAGLMLAVLRSVNDPDGSLHLDGLAEAASSLRSASDSRHSIASERFLNAIIFLIYAGAIWLIAHVFSGNADALKVVLGTIASATLGFIGGKGYGIQTAWRDARSGQQLRPRRPLPPPKL